MMTICIEYADGRVSEYVSEQQARDQIERDYPSAVYAEQWDQSGWNDDGQQMERLCIWATEDDAEDDFGAKAVAQLTRIAGIHH
jgi:hypothetical protein